MYYVYPAYIKKENGRYIVEFIDFELLTAVGKTYEQTLQRAEDILGERLYSLEKESKSPPKASIYKEIQGEKTLIGVDLEMYKKKVMSSSVRKSVTIPSWLNELSITRGINFSKVLQEALKKELGLK